jgi:hypothetical protein
MRFMSQKEREIILAAFVGLDDLIEQYRQAVLWLTIGNHQASPRATEQAIRQHMRELQDKITALHRTRGAARRRRGVSTGVQSG